MATSPSRPRSVFGMIGFAMGATALVMAITLFWAGPFAPQSSAGVSLGELTAEIGKSAVRNLAGLSQPSPQAVERNVDDYLAIGIAVLAGLSIVFAMIAFIRREPLRVALAAGTLGVGAIAFQFFVWYSLVLLFVLLIWAIYQGFGEAISGIFD